MMVLLEILALVLWRIFWKLYLWVPIFAFIIILILRLGLKGKPYRFDIIIMKPGVNEHLERESEDLEFQTEYFEGEEKKTINIKSDRLYRLRPSKRERIKFFFRGVKSKFLIIFREGSQDPVKYLESEVPARILWIVSKSKALQNAGEAEFKVPMDSRKLIIILGAVIIGAIAWLMLTGQVKL